MQVDFIVTEASLRDLFSQYGTVIDVAIKKSTIHKVCDVVVEHHHHVVTMRKLVVLLLCSS